MPLKHSTPGFGSVIKMLTFAAITNNRTMKQYIQNTKFNKLTFLNEISPIIKFDNKRKRVRRRGVFQCECGNVKEYDLSDATTGHTIQCIQCAFKQIGLKKFKHGKIAHPLYRKWQDMKNRCYNKKVDRYENYGGRGIVVCNEWRNDFENFYQWCISNGWRKDLTIDRKRVNENYEPSNCRFIPFAEQGYNKTNTRYVNYNGNDICLAKLLRELNLTEHYFSIHNKIVNRNLNVENVIMEYQLS